MEILDSFVWKFNVLNGSDKKNSVGLIMTGRTGWKNTKKCETWGYLDLTFYYVWSQ